MVGGVGCWCWVLVLSVECWVLNVECWVLCDWCLVWNTVVEYWVVGGGCYKLGGGVGCCVMVLCAG